MEKLDKLTYVEKAEKVINSLKGRDNRGNLKLTTNKIRNLLTLVNEVYHIVQHKTETILDEELQSRVQYTKMRFVYEAGRDPNVKEFVEKSNILSYFDGVGNSRESLILLSHYMEALVAYHRFNSGER